jgi:hypothetical protein
MTAEEIREKRDNALAKVNKRKEIIEKNKKSAEKKLQRIQSKGWELNTSLYKDGNNDEAWWAVIEYYQKLDHIEEAEKKLKEAEKILGNWEMKLAEAEKREDRYTTYNEEMPDVFKQARAELVKIWVAGDIKMRELILKDKKELPYTQFRKSYRLIDVSFYYKTDDEFRNYEEEEADKWLFNLYHRVKNITGEITDCADLHWKGNCLNGIVIGKKGKVRVETIGAGGYNVQKYHLRVLLHKYK